MDKLKELKEALEHSGTLVDEIKDAMRQGQFGELQHKIIHLVENPADELIKLREFLCEQMKRDNERLQARLTLLESSDPDTTIHETSNQSKQIEILSRKVEELKSREEKILNSCRKSTREFREVCYLLTGYRIDPLKDGIFRLSHMYAESEDDQLFFEVQSDGTVSLLENEYTNRYSELISTYLNQGDSFPAFLASITLDLFKSTTHAVEMSMRMSTTMQQSRFIR